MSAIEASSCTAALHHHRLALQSAARNQWYSSKNRTTVSAPLSVMVGFKLTLPYVACCKVWSALASLWLGLYQHIYSESLALRGKIYTSKAEQVALQNQTMTPSFPFSTATPLTLRHSVVSFMLGKFMTVRCQTRDPNADLHQRLIPLSPCSAVDTQVGLKEGIISLWQVVFFHASIS